MKSKSNYSDTPRQRPRSAQISGKNDRGSRRPVSRQAVSGNKRRPASADYYVNRCPPKNKRKKKPLIGILVLILLFVVMVAGGIGAYNYMLTPVSNDTTTQLVEIPEGSNVKSIGTILKENGLIRNTMVFQSYASRHSRGTGGLQAGEYELSPSMSVEEIYMKLVNGETFDGSIAVVIPEGRNAEEIGQILEQNGICSAADFNTEVHDLAKYKAIYPILSGIPDNAERFLEGYLYPDTYNLEPGASAEQVVHTMLDRFMEVYNTEFASQVEASGHTMDDIIIMASLVELETKLAEDKPLAASVFYNRIAANMPLQSDITVDYALGEKHDVLTTEQTQIDSPYNTYINLGLPIGPICSPGHASIEAAINPADTNYLYFVADMSTGKLYFNETLEGHNQDVQTYMGD